MISKHTARFVQAACLLIFRCFLLVRVGNRAGCEPQIRAVRRLPPVMGDMPLRVFSRTRAILRAVSQFLTNYFFFTG